MCKFPLYFLGGLLVVLTIGGVVTWWLEREKAMKNKYPSKYNRGDY